MLLKAETKEVQWSWAKTSVMKLLSHAYIYILTLMGQHVSAITSWPINHVECLRAATSGVILRPPFTHLNNVSWGCYLSLSFSLPSFPPSSMYQFLRHIFGNECLCWIFDTYIYTYVYFFVRREGGRNVFHLRMVAQAPLDIFQ